MQSYIKLITHPVLANNMKAKISLVTRIALSVDNRNNPFIIEYVDLRYIYFNLTLSFPLTDTAAVLVSVCMVLLNSAKSFFTNSMAEADC